MTKAEQYLNEPNKLAAIWLTRLILTSKGKTMRITAGDQVKVVDGELCDCNGYPSHEVVECFGASTHSFSLKLRDLETDLETNIKL